MCVLQEGTKQWIISMIYIKCAIKTKWRVYDTFCVYVEDGLVDNNATERDECRCGIGVNVNVVEMGVAFEEELPLWSKGNMGVYDEEKGDFGFGVSGSELDDDGGNCGFSKARNINLMKIKSEKFRVERGREERDGICKYRKLPMMSRMRTFFIDFLYPTKI